MVSEIRRVLIELNKGNGQTEKKSWRKISRLPRYKGISFATLSAYSRGRPIVNKNHRKIFGLPPLVTVPADMVRKHKPAGQDKPRNRRAINLDDAESAAQTIVKRDTVTDDYIVKLGKLLLAYVAADREMDLEY